MTGNPNFMPKAIKTGPMADAVAEAAFDRVTADRDQSFGVIVQIPGPTPATPGEAFTVAHALGATPSWIAMVDAGDHGGVIYADDVNDKPSWTSATVIVRCTVANETNLAIRLRVRPQ